MLSKMQLAVIRERVGLSIGRASMCWSEVPKGIFDSTTASSLVDDIMEVIERALDSPVSAIQEEGENG